jgi:hypothetical protein
MKPAASPTPRSPLGRYGGWGTLLALLAVLLALFHQSFESGQLLFSSDAPFGLAATEYFELPSAFAGVWQDLNWVGGPAGSAFPSTTYLLLWLFGPVFFAKFYAPVSLLILGLSAWVFFRQLRFRPLTCLLGAIAVALNTDFFSYACWGLGTLTLSVAATLLALAALVTPATDKRWLKDALAGMAVGMSVMEGFDSGAILSVYVAAFVLFQAWQHGGLAALGRGVGRVALVATMAGFIAAQALTILVGTQVIGVVGMEQDQATRQERWDQATQWSLPISETLRTVVAGLYGYRMDTPEGGSYWGRVGEMPGNPEVMRRHSGAGHYAGVPVALLALFGLVQSFRRRDGPLQDEERRWVWFWGVAALVSLALSWGRHAPFYQIVYALPYFSTIRNPIKFLHPFSLALVILFAYGLEAFWRLYADKAVSTAGGLKVRLASWWRAAAVADRRWFAGLGLGTGACLLFWLMYGSTRGSLRTHLMTVVPADESTASLMARHSVAEVGWSVLLLLLTGACLLLIAGRILSGARARWAGVILGLLITGDLMRANAPWVTYWNFADKYEANGLTGFLGEHAGQHRVQLLPNQLWAQPELFQPLQQAGLLNYVQILLQLYRGDWLQHGFRYHNIQSLDVVQEPRVATDNALYRQAFRNRGIEGEIRLWELTNTRYIFALGGDVVTILNQLLDPARQRLRSRLPFTVEQTTAGAPITVQTNAVGPFALLEFTGALPRAALYSRWLVQTNDAVTLEKLADPLWDPARSVIVAESLPTAPAPPTSTNAARGSVEFVSYAPKHIVLQAEGAQPSVLLLNDKHDPEWQVTVDGKPAPLLRCNFLMRGVFLEAGPHEVEFRYAPSKKPLMVSLLAVVIALGLVGYVGVESRRRRKANSDEVEAGAEEGEV